MTISNCGQDERGRYSGGQAGDQTGTEYYLRPWYLGGWDGAFVHPDAKIRQAIADAATKAANNNKIGYDQGERLTFYYNLRTAGWYPEKITQACEADCSSSSAACVIAAGHRCGNAKLQGINPSCVTGNIGQALVSAGFVKFTGSKYLTSDAYLPAGTILNRSSGHVVVVVTDGAYAAETVKAAGGGNASASIYTPASATGELVRQAQSYLVNAGFGVGSAGVDGDYGPATKRANVKHVQTALNALGAGLEVDGANGPLTKAAWAKYGPVRNGSTGALVRAVQVALMLHGFGIGNAGIDGDCGPATASAITSFQRAHNLEVDGITGPQTFASLF